MVTAAGLSPVLQAPTTIPMDIPPPTWWSTNCRMSLIFGNALMFLSLCSLACSAASLVMTLTVPLPVMFLVSSAAMSVLGDFILRNERWVCSLQPTGIDNTFKNNCWLHSGLQAVILQNPHVRNWLLRSPPRELEPFRDFIRQYQTDQSWREWETRADSWPLRGCLRALNPSISERGNDDANEGVRAIMNFLPATSPLMVPLTTFRYYNLDGLPDPIDPSLTIRQESDGRRVAISQRTELTWGDVNLNLTQQDAPADFMTLVQNFFQNAQGGETAGYNSAPNVRTRYPLIGERRMYNQNGAPAVPPYLFFNFSRFQFDLSVMGVRKITTSVHLPPRFTLPREYTNSNDAATYELESIVVHGGTPTVGHYWAYVKRQGNWFLCNDSRITLVTEAEALSQAHPYNCYYRRIA